MPMYDRRCTSCDWTDHDRFEHRSHEALACPACGAASERFCDFGSGSANIVRDEIPGGMLIENLTPEPIRVYHKSEKRRIMDALGVEEFVRHQPEQGTDKSKHTQSWAVGVPLDEMERIALMLERVQVGAESVRDL